MTAAATHPARHNGQYARAPPLFDPMEFAPAYAVEIDPEFPGDGNWRTPFFGYDREGSPSSELPTRWGCPLVASIEPDSGDGWVAAFADGGLGAFRGFFATADPTGLLAVAGGLAYLINVTAPGAAASIVKDQVVQVSRVSDPPLLLVVSDLDMAAIGADGLRWTTRRLCVDSLRVASTSPTAIVCTCDNLGHSPTITLDPRTGEQTDGTDLRTFWPPDALA